jgi:hypothetical protein
MDLEGEYLPRVVTRENGRAVAEARRAQAIAARTYLARAMRDDHSLGVSKPLSNSEHFQTYAQSATAEATRATESTRGVVARYQRQLILANYVAGALWVDDTTRGQDPTHTERFVTYNAGRRGADVIPTKLANPARPDNRGCMSQNGSDFLARRMGDNAAAILRFFYGADLELEGLDPAPELPPSTPTRPSTPASPPASGSSSASSSAAPLLVGAAAAALAWWKL